MSAFALVKSQLHCLAIHPSKNLDHSNFPFGWQNVAITVLITSHALLVFVNLLFGICTYDERSGIFFVSLTAMLGAIFYLSFVYQKRRIFCLIDDLDEFVTKR